ncbi:hypothetical protein [Thorsellia kenyensis]
MMPLHRFCWICPICDKEHDSDLNMAFTSNTKG